MLRLTPRMERLRDQSAHERKSWDGDSAIRVILAIKLGEEKCHIPTVIMRDSGRQTRVWLVILMVRAFGA